MKTKLSLFAISFILTSCATNTSPEFIQMQEELAQEKEKNSQLQNKFLMISNEQSELDKSRLESLNSQVQSSNNSALVSSEQKSDLLPPNAKPGECYARVLTPADYKTETTKVLKKEKSFRLEVTPATYEIVTTRVQVKEASEIGEVVPAVYEWKTEQVLVEEAYDKLQAFPTVYETKVEKMLVKKAYKTWEKGRGPIEKIDNSTGEIMCLVDVPAEYKTITSKVVKSKAYVKKVTIPAVYKAVKKRVMVKGPTIVKKAIPAVYADVKVRKIVKPSSKKSITLPAQYQTVSNRIKLTDSSLEWRSILCETNTTEDIVFDIQRALLEKGHSPGPLDGVIGVETMSAVKSYQKEKKLAVGQLTFETLKSLGIEY